MSIVNEQTLKVRCQKGYQFGGESNLSNRGARKKIRFIRCRNSAIINRKLPKCKRIGNSNHPYPLHAKSNFYDDNDERIEKVKYYTSIKHKHYHHENKAKGFKLITNTTVSYFISIKNLYDNARNFVFDKTLLFRIFIPFMFNILSIVPL